MKHKEFKEHIEELYLQYTSIRPISVESDGVKFGRKYIVTPDKKLQFGLAASIDYNSQVLN